MGPISILERRSESRVQNNWNDIARGRAEKVRWTETWHGAAFEFVCDLLFILLLGVIFFAFMASI